MLSSLEVRDLLIIDRLELGFRPGLNVLTGETGAGKSILLDALGFVLGWRSARGDLLRPGAERGEVTAVFAPAPDHPVGALLAEAGLDAGEELILRRALAADGRRSGWVNDRRVSAEVLRGLGDSLVELHGQHDDRGLLNPRGHRRLLDAFAAAPPLVEATRAAWRALAEARRARDEAAERQAALRAEEDWLRHASAELAQLDPRPGEAEALDARRRLMKNAHRIAEDVARAQAALGPEGAEGRIADALRWLEAAAPQAEGRLDAPVTALSATLDGLAEAARGVEDCLAAMAADPGELERVEERLFAIRGLARKHDTDPDTLGDLARDLAARLDALDAAGDEAGRLERAVAEAEAAYHAAADRLGKARREAAGRLDAAVSAELPPLKLERARFVTEVTDAEPGPEGRDAVAFTVATNPGADPGPIDRIASGGELSRFLLALKLSLAAGEGQTLIFDEIDRGVGGATADAVGRRLARLAQTAQVLVVTHSPQVAARGQHHWRVEKRLADSGARSTVTALAPAARIDEIARMLSGEEITDEARGAARALLAG